MLETLDRLQQSKHLRDKMMSQEEMMTALQVGNLRAVGGGGGGGGGQWGQPLYHFFSLHAQWTAKKIGAARSLL